jgi:tryptophanyl-tRNA synthetase
MKILSGIQPSGDLHIGNYLGALRNFVALQDENPSDERLYMVADLHALTSVHDAKKLREMILSAKRSFLALGLDPASSTLFVQSEVPAHAELAWIFSTIIPMGELKRMTQFKDKTSQYADQIKKEATSINKGFAKSSSTLNKLADEVGILFSKKLGEEEIKVFQEVKGIISDIEKEASDLRKRYLKQLAEGFAFSEANLGLFSYPILMTADILLYKAEAVPVGEDQVQHLELTRTIARKFNTTYGETFKEPKPLLKKDLARVMSLQDPTKKMSKSLGPTHYVGLFEDEDSIRDKFKRAVTDSGSDITYDPQNKPGVSNLLSIYAGMTNTTPQEAQGHFAGKNYGQLKEEVAETVLETLKPMRERFNELTEIDIEAAFQQGREKATAEAEKTLKEVKERVGL